MAVATSMGGSCGMVAIYSLVNIKDFLATYAACRKLPFVVFSDTITNGRGEKIYQSLKEMGAGDVHKSTPRMNPNSNNDIVLYYWQPSQEYRNSLDPHHPTYNKFKPATTESKDSSTKPGV